MTPLPQHALIRPVVAGDFDAWLGLWGGYNSFYGPSGPPPPTMEVNRTTWARFLDAKEPMHALVAEGPAGLLGLAHFLFHGSTKDIGPVCYLQDLFTIEAARGRGVGRALVDAVYRQAQAAGAPRVYWQTHESNVLAMRLYDKVADKSGFVVYRKML